MDAVPVDPLAGLLSALGLSEQAQDPITRALLLLCLGMLLAGLVDLALRLFRRVVAERTRITLDELVIDHLRRPVVMTVLFAGVWYATLALQVGTVAERALGSALATIAIVLWTWSLFGLARHALQRMAAEAHDRGMVQVRTFPLFDMLAKGLIIGGCAYALMVAWHIDVTAWLASAGVLGIAVGFAAQDTLSNLLAGVVIIADAPYRIGDFLQLESGERGRVTQIGLRSTRLLTQDNVEIIVPNSVMASARITNPSGGGLERERLQVACGVAYGTDLERARAVLLEVARGTEGVIHDDPACAPVVQLRALGESSLDLVVLAWIPRPEHRWVVLDRLNSAIYTRLRAEGIEIPFPQRDLHIRSMPGRGD